MATYLDGNRRRATANTVAAMHESAERRRCPRCGRKSAMKRVDEPDLRGTYCRWDDCDYSRLRHPDDESYDEARARWARENPEDTPVAESTATREAGGRYQRMSYLDVAEQDGPAWSYYQLMRARDGVFEDPDRVPDWALRDMALHRVAEGRIACEFLVPPGARGQAMTELHAALGLVEAFLRHAATDVEQDVQQHVAAALLGAREIHEQRDRIDAGLT